MKIKVQLEDTFEKIWDFFNKISDTHTFSEKTEYISFDKNTKVYDTDKKEYVWCKTLLQNKNVSNWCEVKFDNGKSLVLTDDHPLYLSNRGRTFVKDCIKGDKIKYKDTITTIIEIDNLNRVADSYDVETETDRFELSGFNSGNCRTRVIGNINGAEQTTGRGNFAFHTINLPRLAIETYMQSKDVEEKKKIFFEKLDAILEDVKGSLLDRFTLICNKTYENFPFTMQQGLYLTSDDKPHKVTDKIADVLKQSTLSIGYVGLAETMMLLTGKTYGIDHDIDEYALSIIKHIREFTDKCQKETHLNWSCFATPAEAVAGRFANIDKNRYEKEKKLAGVDLNRLFGKGYYTNSHMIDYSLDTSLDNKIKTEAPFHAITNAGHIFYYKMNGDLSKNIPAVKACIDEMYEGNLGYFTVTFDSDTCLNCKYHGIIDDKCPECGIEDEEHIVRVRRITGYLTGSPRKSITKSWNDGKLNELRDRHNI